MTGAAGSQLGGSDTEAGMIGVGTENLASQHTEVSTLGLELLNVKTEEMKSPDF